MSYVDMRTAFEFKIDGIPSDTLRTESPADAVDALLKHCQDQGLDISEKRRKQAVELLRFGRVTL